MSASKNCPCPVCKKKAMVMIDVSCNGWYFNCEECKTTIGITGMRQSIRTEHGITHVFIEHFGAWRTAKEAIKAIKEYMR